MKSIVSYIIMAMKVVTGRYDKNDNITRIIDKSLSIEDLDIIEKNKLLKPKWPLNYIPPRHLRLDKYDYDKL